MRTKTYTPSVKWLLAPLAALALSPATLQAQDDTGADVPADTPTEEAPHEMTRRERKVETLKEDTASTPRQQLYATQPEGKTLPEGLMRIRIPYQSATGNVGYDKDGNKVDLGAELKASGTGLVIEYGVTSKFTVQVLAPFVLNNEVGLNANQFRKSNTYKQNYNNFVSKVAAGLAAAGAPCGTPAGCSDYINNGGEAFADIPVTLPTGETFTIKSGQQIKTAADALVVNGAKPAKGKTGLGDVQFGGLYEVLGREGPVYFSIGGGVRFPTGSYEDVASAYRGTSRGVTELGLRTNLDFDVMHGLMLSWQNQFEHPLSKGKKKRSSLLDPTKLNEANPTDGVKNDQTMERVGTRSVGFVRLKTGFGLIDEVLNPYGFYVGWEYDYNNAIRLDGVETSPRSQLHSLSTGVSADLVPYKIPLRVDYDYITPMGGKNVQLAANYHVFTLKAFYLF